MSTVATCQCGARFAAQEHLAGTTVPCPTCGQPLTIPLPQASAHQLGPSPSVPLSPSARQTSPPQAPASPRAKGASFPLPLVIGIAGVLVLLVAVGILGVVASQFMQATRPPASAASPDSGGPPTPLTNVHQAGTEIDLLTLIDPQRDAVRGEFRLDDGALWFGPSRAAQLNFNVELPEQYELRMVVARVQGDESLNLGIHVGSATTMVVIEGWGRKICGLNTVDGRIAENNPTSQTWTVFPDRSPREIRIVVRRESVMAYAMDGIGGNGFIDFRGSPSRLGFDERFFQRPGRDQLMVGGWESAFKISSWKLIPLGDEPMRSDGPPKSDETPSAGELANAEPPADRDTGSGPTNPATGRDATQSDPPKLASNQEPQPNAKVPDEPGSTTEPPDPPPEAPPATAPPSVVWRATVDPLPAWDAPLAAHIDWALHSPQGWAVMPNSPSHYLAIAEPVDDQVQWTVYDLRKNKPVGHKVRVAVADRGEYELAASGEYLASYVGSSDSRRLEVHSFATGQLVYSTESSGRNSLGDWRRRRDYLAANQSLLRLRERDREFQLRRVDLKSGQETAAWNTGLSTQYRHAFSASPGGRFAVLTSRNVLTVFDALSGERAGALGLPDPMTDIDAFAFSADGRELAVLGHQAEKDTLLLWCIDWATGETRLAADVGAKLDSLINTYQWGPPLQWFPDKSLLLYYGRDVIDRESGRYCYRIPQNLHWQLPRRALTADTILAVMSGEQNVRNYRTVKIDRRQLDQALKFVRKGGSAVDIGLPPLTVADASTAASLPDTGQAGSLSIEPESPVAPPDDAIQLPVRLVRSREIGTRLKALQFAAADPNVAIGHFHVEPGRDADPRQMVVRFDLRRGTSTGSLPMRDDYRLLDVSPDGSRALIGLVNQANAYSRLDVVDLKTRQHLAGWRPYAGESFKKNVSPGGQPAALNPQEAVWVRFVDGERVVTVNPEGKLIAWRLPDCTAVFVCENFGKPFQLSGQRRYLAGSHGEQIHVLDVRDGKWAGQLKLDVDPPSDILRAAFRPDCRELVAILHHRGRREIAFWDLTSGQLGDRFDIPYTIVNPAQWVGFEYKWDGYLLLDKLYLIDRQRHTSPWLYRLDRTVRAAEAPGPREWFAQQVPGNDNGQVFDWMLSARPIPDDDVQDAIRNAVPLQRPAGSSILELK